MTKPFIVVSDGMDKGLFKALCETSEFEVHPESKISQDQLKELLPKVAGLVIRSATKPDKEMMDAAPNLKYIIRAGEGTDNIDKAYAAQKEIKVSNTPGANNNSAAEHAIALMMTVLRKTAWANSSMQAGRWDKALFTGNELANKTVGIVGFGRIGQIVAKRLAGFDPKILFFDPIVNACDLSYAEKRENVEDIFIESDIITIHVPLIEPTKNMIDSALLNLMKPSAILVNAARGGIVVEEALLEVLQSKKIRGAGFDVFSTEPLPEDSALRKCDNLITTPHLGASTQEAQLRVGEMAVHQLQQFFLNDNLLNEVTA